jgi:indole-3-glycerol phosphate synthase
MNELERIVGLTRTEVDRRRRVVAPEELARAASGGRVREEGGASFTEAVSSAGLALIAEHKRRSPSAGLIREGVAVEEVVAAYERGRAAAISILTEGPSFGGSLEDLRAARATCSLPLLRKDFIIDRYQIDEAVLAGADAILLIVAALSAEELRGLLVYASERGLDALVEVHDERELERALEAGAAVVGINNRDLTRLTVDVRRTYELLPLVPAGIVVVAESGFSRHDELDLLAGAGVAAVLVGEALMRAPDIEAAVRNLTGNRQSVH